MTNPLKNDNFLMRFKDLILLGLALLGLLGYIGKGFNVSSKIEETAKEISEHKRKYEPMVDKHETLLAVQEKQFDQIMDSLKEIKRTVNRDK